MYLEGRSFVVPHTYICCSHCCCCYCCSPFIVTFLLLWPPLLVGDCSHITYICSLLLFLHYLLPTICYLLLFIIYLFPFLVVILCYVVDIIVVVIQSLVGVCFGVGGRIIYLFIPRTEVENVLIIPHCYIPIYYPIHYWPPRYIGMGDLPVGGWAVRLRWFVRFEHSFPGYNVTPITPFAPFNHSTLHYLRCCCCYSFPAAVAWFLDTTLRLFLVGCYLVVVGTFVTFTYRVVPVTLFVTLPHLRYSYFVTVLIGLVGSGWLGRGCCLFWLVVHFVTCSFVAFVRLRYLLLLRSTFITSYVYILHLDGVYSHFTFTLRSFNLIPFTLPSPPHTVTFYVYVYHTLRWAGRFPHTFWTDVVRCCYLGWVGGTDSSLFRVGGEGNVSFHPSCISRCTPPHYHLFHIHTRYTIFITGELTICLLPFIYFTHLFALYRLWSFPLSHSYFILYILHISPHLLLLFGVVVTFAPFVYHFPPLLLFVTHDPSLLLSFYIYITYTLRLRLGPTFVLPARTHIFATHTPSAFAHLHRCYLRYISYHSHLPFSRFCRCVYVVTVIVPLYTQFVYISRFWFTLSWLDERNFTPILSLCWMGLSYLLRSLPHFILCVVLFTPRFPSHSFRDFVPLICTHSTHTFPFSSIYIPTRAFFLCHSPRYHFAFIWYVAIWTENFISPHVRTFPPLFVVTFGHSSTYFTFPLLLLCPSLAPLPVVQSFVVHYHSSLCCSYLRACDPLPYPTPHSHLLSIVVAYIAPSCFVHGDCFCWWVMGH